METRAPQSVMPLIAAPQPKTRRASVPTELPEVKTVKQPEPLANARPARDHLAEEEASRAEARERAQAVQVPAPQTQVRTHEATGSVVIQTLNANSGDVQHQFPNNATLKQRAIARYEALQGTATIKRLA